ncbi:MAG TPA: carboxypeptidase-like regulatory domain-containing protein [Candidatus Binatus sp.]|nr:carboxypeptidase-like regulatory domain-containing protein [Candidatus Binatus sp.]
MKPRLALPLCLLFSSAIAAQIPASKPPTHCTIEGQIVQQPGGQPVRKADVRLFSIGEHQEVEEQEYSAATDAEGHFKIEDLKPGIYRLHYDRTGFVDAERRHHGDEMLLSLAPGQDVKDLLFHMAPAAVITGKVTDADGDPVPNVEVAAIPPHFNRNIVPAVSGGFTNDLGEYRIGGLSPNRYLVMVTPLRLLRRSVESTKGSDKRPPVYGVTYFPGTTDKSQALPLVLRSGDETPANIALALTHLLHVRGEVTNLPAGTTDEVSVVLRPLDDDFMAAIENWPLDKDGKFDIRGMLPGSYSVLLVFGSSLSPRVMRGDQTVQVINADVEGLRISAVPNGQVRGQFRMDNGQKIDWSSVNVNLYSNRTAPPMGSSTSSGNGFDALYWDERPVHGEVSSGGSFEMKDVPGDTYRLWTTSDKVLRDYFVKAVTLGGKDIIDSGFTVGGATYSLDVVVSAKGATVDGVVLNDKDEPASDVHVVAIPDVTRHQRRDLYQLTTTDYRGRFGLHGLAPGEYRIFALDDDYPDVTDSEFLRAHESSGKTIKLEESEHKSIELTLEPSGD